uniref:Uncharacterized protein n=1 Tax=uncultured marine group II/III euryarchaeote KM3_62_D04 TaxID=1456473 RepID=A0A075HE66_9EURY|nr:hypothetical protein [uncultured marine group II/III euryarchaeote KM3_62_D04]
MGELPPLHTPQGPGVPRAFRPGFPRVDSSGTSSAPSSRSASFPFLASGSPHFAHLLSPGAFPPLRVLRFLPLPCVRFSPRSDTASSTDLSALVHSCFPPLPSRSFPFLASGSRRSLHFVPHTASRFVLLPLPRVSPRDSSSASVLVFPVAGSVSLFLSFLLRFLQLPSPSFPFLSSSSPQFSPLSSSSVLPSSSRPHGVPTCSPSSFRIPGSAAALSRLGFCGPQVAPKRPHTTPEKRQS